MSAPYSLIIDTSTNAHLLLIDNMGQCLQEALESGRGAAEALQTRLSEFLQRQNAKVSDIGKIYIACGPGSFTGLRVGIAYIQGLTFQSETQVYAYSSLLPLKLLLGNRLGVALIPAKKGSYYVEINDVHAEKNEEHLLSELELSEFLSRYPYIATPEPDLLPEELCTHKNLLCYLPEYPYQLIVRHFANAASIKAKDIKANYILKSAAEIHFENK